MILKRLTAAVGHARESLAAHDRGLAGFIIVMSANGQPAIAETSQPAPDRSQ
jgi:hypothetical protein